MAQTIEQGDIFGRIGKAIGQGASEQAERNLLGKGIEQIQGIPPEIARIARLPGGKEFLPNVINYIQNRGASEQVLKQSGISPQSQTELSQPSSAQQTSPSQKAPAPTRVERLTSDPEAINVRAAQRQLANPLAFPTLAAAREYEQNRVNTQNQQIETVRNDFDKIMSGLVQKGGTETYKDVLGELQENFRKQAEDSVISGRMTEKEAARHFGEKALDFAKARNKFTVPGRDFWRSLVSSSPLKEVKAAKRAYDEAGIPEAFLNDLVSKRKFSLPYASELAFPPTAKAKDFFNHLKFSGFVKKEDPKTFDKALQLLTPKDSLQAFAAELNRKGFSPTAFLDYAATNGALTPFQERELENYSNFQPSITDILYFTLSGKKP